MKIFFPTPYILPARVCDTLNGQARVGLYRTLSEQTVVVFLHQLYLGSLPHGDLNSYLYQSLKIEFLPASSSHSSQVS